MRESVVGSSSSFTKGRNIGERETPVDSRFYSSESSTLAERSLCCYMESLQSVS